MTVQSFLSRPDLIWAAAVLALGGIYWFAALRTQTAPTIAFAAACMLVAGAGVWLPRFGLDGALLFLATSFLFRGLILLARAGSFTGMTATGAGLGLLMMTGGAAWWLVFAAVPLLIVATRRAMIASAPAAYYAVVLFPAIMVLAFAGLMHVGGVALPWIPAENAVPFPATDAFLVIGLASAAALAIFAMALIRVGRRRAYRRGLLVCLAVAFFGPGFVMAFSGSAAGLAIFATVLPALAGVAAEALARRRASGVLLLSALGIHVAGSAVLAGAL